MAKASELLRGSKPRFGFAIVDCTKSGKDTCSEYSINDSTFKIFRRDKIGQNYAGMEEAGMCQPIV